MQVTVHEVPVVPEVTTAHLEARRRLPDVSSRLDMIAEAVTTSAKKAPGRQTLLGHGFHGPKAGTVTTTVDVVPV